MIKKYILIFTAFVMTCSQSVYSKEYSMCELSENIWYTLSNMDSTGNLDFNYSECKLDLTNFKYLAIPVKNESSQKLLVDAYWGNGKKWLDFNARYIISPNVEDTVKFLLHRRKDEIDKDWYTYFPKARGFPGGTYNHWRTINFSELKYIRLCFSKIDDQNIEQIYFKPPVGMTGYKSIDFKDLNKPFIDEFGQDKNSSWNGKIKTIQHLEENGQQDMKKFTQAKFDTSFSRFGGIISSKKQQATGFFRTEYIDDNWWIIDPEGYLFWSSGLTGIGKSSPTKILKKEFLFSDISEDINQLSSAEKIKVKTKRGVNYYNLNLKRKYGDNWESKHEEITAGRCKSWGINTVGPWSINMYTNDLPFTLIVSTKKQNIGKIQNTIDPFNPLFLAELRRKFNNLKKFRDNPWLLGVFVHNEIHWEKNIEIPIELLGVKSIPARDELENFLADKYKNIQSLNLSWETTFTDFKEINKDVNLGNTIIQVDLHEFFEHYVETYFKLVEAEFRKSLPNHLYLGCRLYEKTHHNVTVRKFAAKYSDIVSYNIYRYSLKDFNFLRELEKPVLIGEFHFGTGSHGVWGTGLRVANSLEQQSRLYEQFIYEAAKHPSVVGAHWFQWSDQPATGRFDGENFRVGFVSITDQPYQKLIETARQTSLQIRQWRN